MHGTDEASREAEENAFVLREVDELFLLADQVHPHDSYIFHRGTADIREWTTCNLVAWKNSWRPAIIASIKRAKNEQAHNRVHALIDLATEKGMDTSVMLAQPMDIFLKKSTHTLNQWAIKWWPFVEQDDTSHTNNSEEEQLTTDDENEDEMNATVSQTLTDSHGGVLTTARIIL